jgi:hypothetical protein
VEVEVSRLEKNEKETLLSHLQNVLRAYLNQRTHMSLNSLSKKCSVSEPTLRRIMKGQIKTLPNVTTVLDILTYVSGEKNTFSIAEKYPGPIADFLKEMLPHVMECHTNYDVALNNELKHPTKYLIYKLASNSSGVKPQKIQELFGSHGMIFLQELVDKNYVILKDEVYISSSDSFTSSHEDFVEKFKTVSDFIKVQNNETNVSLNPLFVNYSNSVSAEVYKEVISLQRRTLKKIRTLLSDDRASGDIPLFLLLAVDTLDNSTAHEIEKNKK